MAPARSSSSRYDSPVGAGRASGPRREPGEGPRVCVAQIGSPHGIRGEVRLRSFTEHPMGLTQYSGLESEDGLRAFHIESVRPAGDSLIVRFAGVADRETAAELRNIKLYVPRARLPEPDEETYYHADLIGLMAVDPGGAVLGTIRAVQNFGAGDLVEIATAGGGPSVLLPFTKRYVPVVDIPGGRVVVEMPADLLRDTSPSRTRVFPSSALDDGSKSETSEVDAGEVGSRAARASREGRSRTRTGEPPHPSPSRGEGGDCG